MATKAERFKVERQREAHDPKKTLSKKTKRKRLKAAAKAKLPPKSLRGRTGKQLTANAAPPNPTPHNEGPRAGKTSRYELELASKRPSRKQTRKSNHRQKTDNALRITEMARVASPKSRAGRASGNPN
jgi:hypothetical protein